MNKIVHDYEKIPVPDSLKSELDKYFSEVCKANVREEVENKQLLPMIVLSELILNYFTAHKFKIEDIFTYIFGYIDLVIHKCLTEIKESDIPNEQKLYALIGIHNYFSQSIANNIIRYPILKSPDSKTDSGTSEADSSPAS